MPKNEIRYCTGDNFCTGTSSVWGENFVTAQPFRLLPGNKHLHCELFGKQFPDHETAAQAMIERGYNKIFYRRMSRPLPIFSKLAHCKLQAKFDALYRFWKHQGKNKQSPLYVRLTKLAERVGIFHPVANNWGKKFPRN